MNILESLVDALIDDLRRYTLDRKSTVEYYIWETKDQESAPSISLTQATASVSNFSYLAYYTLKVSPSIGKVTSTLRITHDVDYKLTAMKYQSALDFIQSVQSIMFEQRMTSIAAPTCKSKLGQVLSLIDQEEKKIDEMRLKSNSTDNGEYEALLNAHKNILKWALNEDNTNFRALCSALSFEAVGEDAKKSADPEVGYGANALLDKRLREFLGELAAFMYKIMRDAYIDTAKSGHTTKLGYTRLLPNSEVAEKIIQLVKKTIFTLVAISKIEAKEKIQVIITSINGVLRNFEQQLDELPGNEFLNKVVIELNKLEKKARGLDENLVKFRALTPEV